jgi:hypothetical protein
MSAIPEDFMRQRKRPMERPDDDTRAQKFWLWFALAALVFCWIAEATMCAVRGF